MDDDQVTPQDQPVVDAPVDAPADTPEPSLSDQLAAAREEEPLTTDPDDTPTDPAPSADTEETTPPADKPVEDEPTDPANPDDQPDDNPLKGMTKEERKDYFENLTREQQARDESTVTQKLDEKYKTQDQDELKQHFKDQGYDDFQSEILAREERRDQQAQLNEARTQIIAVNAQVNGEALKVMHDFPIFDPNSTSYDKEFADRAAAMYQKAANPVHDEKSGVLVSTNLMPYEFYQELSNIRDAGLSQAQKTAQQNAERQMAAVAPPSSSPPPPATPNVEDSQAQGLENALNNVR